MPGRLPADTPAVVLPLARNSTRSDAMPRPAAAPGPSGLERLLRLAAARGADALYLFTNTPPSLRHDGDTSTIEGERVLGGADIEALLLEAVADRRRDPGDTVEWTMEIPEVGRVLAVRVRDQRGPGAVFRLSPARVTPAEQLGLPREIQTLCAEPEGLLLVAGPRGGGKSTVVAAMVDQINRTRRDYVVLLESRTTVAHDNRLAIVSQREVTAGGGALATAIRGARREGADVIAVEDLETPDALLEAIEAAASGHLVIAGVTAPSATAALARLLERVPAPLRDTTQAQLAHALRGVIAQVLLRKNAGGRVAAREVLLNGPSVTQLLAAGDLARLPLAIENGRRAGMVPLTDALVGFVQSGAVDVREAWRRAPDRPALLRALEREGIDTSFVERLA
jgi:twitching motility protein PilT